jgi:type IV pilus assembly protein PilA
MFMKKRDEKGFTLIELMIVIAIIGILAAIAIPQFNAYRARSYNAAANTDIRNLMTACEGYFVDWDTYPLAAATEVNTVLAKYGYGTDSVSPGVNPDRIEIERNDTGTAYSITNVFNSRAGDEYAVTYSANGPGGGIDKDAPAEAP